jgi:hypothetical protein
MALQHTHDNNGTEEKPANINIPLVNARPVEVNPRRRITTTQFISWLVESRI